MRYYFTYEPPQPNSPFEEVMKQDWKISRGMPQVKTLWIKAHISSTKNKMNESIQPFSVWPKNKLNSIHLAFIKLLHATNTFPCWAIHNHFLKAKIKNVTFTFFFVLSHSLRKTMFKVVVFQFRQLLVSHLFYTFKIISHFQTRVKLNLKKK